MTEHPTTGEVFAQMSWRDRRLFAISQAGLVEKFIDALVWALFPIFLVGQGASPAYAVRVADVLMSTGFDPRRLEVEVTETPMSDKEGHGRTNVAALRDPGVRFALDDFGTDFSSLGRLHQLDVNRIKIDRSFVQGFGSENGDEAIVQAIVDLTKATGVKTTAEGVETVEQEQFLSEIGCDELQGFRLSKPLARDDLQKLLMGTKPAVHS